MTSDVISFRARLSCARVAVSRRVHQSPFLLWKDTMTLLLSLQCGNPQFTCGSDSEVMTAQCLTQVVLPRVFNAVFKQDVVLRTMYINDNNVVASSIPGSSTILKWIRSGTGSTHSQYK